MRNGYCVTVQLYACTEYGNTLYDLSEHRIWNSEWRNIAHTGILNAYRCRTAIGLSFLWNALIETTISDLRTSYRGEEPWFSQPIADMSGSQICYIAFVISLVRFPSGLHATARELVQDQGIVVAISATRCPTDASSLAAGLRWILHSGPNHTMLASGGPRAAESWAENVAVSMSPAVCTRWSRHPNSSVLAVRLSAV